MLVERYSETKDSPHETRNWLEGLGVQPASIEWVYRIRKNSFFYIIQRFELTKMK